MNMEGKYYKVLRRTKHNAVVTMYPISLSELISLKKPYSKIHIHPTKTGVPKHPHFLNFRLKTMSGQFIISVEGNGDIGVSPLPQTETYAKWFTCYTSYPLFAVEDSFFLSIYGCCDYLCNLRQQISPKVALKLLTYP